MSFINPLQNVYSAKTHKIWLKFILNQISGINLKSKSALSLTWGELIVLTCAKLKWLPGRRRQKPFLWRSGSIGPSCAARGQQERKPSWRSGRSLSRNWNAQVEKNIKLLFTMLNSFLIEPFTCQPEIKLKFSQLKLITGCQSRLVYA